MSVKKGIQIKLWQAPIVYSILFFALGMFWFAEYYKVSVLFAVAVMIWLFMTSDIKKIEKPAVLLLLSFVLWGGLTIFWAISGKFYLREFSKTVLAVMFFLIIVLKGKKTVECGRWIFSVLAGVTALCGLISIEAASTGFFGKVFNNLPGLQGVFMGFETGTRMMGIFGNPNVLASILAVGIFFSMTLLFHADDRKEKVLYAVYSGCSAYAFLLCFSMGAIASFFVALVLYFVFSGKERGAALVRMMLILVPSVVFGFLAFPCFDREGIFKIFPLLLLVVDIAVIFFLREKTQKPLVVFLEKHRIHSARLSVAVLGVVVLFCIAACHIDGSYMFGKELRRSGYPDAGEHTLVIDADGSVKVSIVSQTRAQTMMHTNTVIYEGEAKNANFIVPEGSTVCFFTFTADSGTKFLRASVDGTEKIHLNYLLMPDSVANRLQGLFANENFIQRLVFYRDGLRLFGKSPILGSGVGAFETGVTGVQDFYYTSKYVHNHYIQVLAEMGVVGFFLYISTILLMIVVLIKRRKSLWNEMCSQLYPAVVSALFMSLIHSAVDVSLSSGIFLCMLYAVFGIIILFFAEPGKVLRTGKTTAHTGKVPYGRVIRVGSSVVLVVFGLTVVGNLIGTHSLNQTGDSDEQFLKSMERAAVWDIYEKNNYKLSYLYMVMQNQMTGHLEQANQYAEELMGARSNTIPGSLVLYYAWTGQYQYAIRAAKMGAVYSASDSKVWNQCVSLLRQAFFEAENSPLLTDGKTLIPLLGEYDELWRKRSEIAMETIVLDEGNTRFFDTIEKLQGCEDDSEQIKKILYENQE